MIDIVERRLEMPDAFEFPRMLRAVIPLMCSRHTVVNEHAALAFGHSVRAFEILRAAARRLPRFAAIVRALNDLSEPRARLRRVQSIRINRRTFDVINFPASKMRPAHL